MYKLLLVDDEPDILNSMAKGIPWAVWGFEVAGQAKNGVEALELIKTLHPKVVLSDIRMPQMDGIQLMKKVNQQWPEIKMLILSGYSDVEYLKTAITNHVVEYLLKPTDLDEFETVFQKIKEELDKEQKQVDEIQDLKKKVVENKDYQYARILNDLIRGYAFDSNYQILMEELGIQFKNCLIMVFDFYNPNLEKEELGSKIALLKRIIRYCNSRQASKNAYYFAGFSEQMVGILSFQETEKEWKGIVTNYLQELQSEIQDLYGIESAVGVSDICNQVSRLYSRYEQAIKCMKQKTFLGTLSIVLYPDLQDFGDSQYNMWAFETDKIKQCILNGDLKGIEEEIDRVWQQFENKLMKDTSYIDRITLECFYQISRWALSVYQIRLEQLLAIQGKNYFDIQNMTLLKEKKDFLCQTFLLVSNEIKEIQESGKSMNSLAQIMKEYVDKEYCSNSISLDLVAEKVKKNAAYLSKLFKRETGYNFSDYITQKRIEKSKELLLDPSLKIYHIAEMMGYADVSNFIKVFKKNCGVSPNEYRNLHGAQKL